MFSVSGNNKMAVAVVFVLLVFEFVPMLVLVVVSFSVFVII